MSSAEFKDECRRLLNDIHNLLGKTIKNTKISDEKEKANNVPWFERHRLHVLIETARLALRTKDNAAFSPWFIVELRSIVNLVQRWKKDDIWKLIEPTLKSKTSFLHAIGQLTLHDILLKQGNNVTIVSTGGRPTPDLVLKAKAGTQETVYLEIYHPRSFSGKTAPLSIEDLRKIVKKSLNKAKRQLSVSHPGLIAIIAHNQHPANFLKLKELMAGRLDETKRLYLAGVIFLNLGINAVKVPSGISWSRIVRSSYLANPSYFGSVAIITDGAEETSSTIPIVERATGIRTDELIGKKVSDIDLRNIETMVEEIHVERKISTLHLDKLDDPNPRIHTIITSEKEITLFLGDSNQNYACSNCGMILAERVWTYSLVDIILKCPKCHLFFEVPQVRADFPNFPIKSIAIEVGEYNFSDGVRLKRNISMFGGVSRSTIKKMTQLRAREV